MAEAPREPYVVGIDCSTTAAKAVVFDRAGRTVALAREGIALDRPRPGWHEQAPTEWWNATRRAVGRALAALPEGVTVSAVCIAHQRESFALLDATGAELRPGILWVDSRASEEIAEYGAPWVQEVSGKPPDVTPALYKLAWLRKHEPATLERAARVVDVHGYLTYKMTGLWATSEASADALGVMDIRRRAYSPDLLDIAGVRADQLPRLVPPGEVIGNVAPALAEEWGVAGPLPLVAGLGDGQSAALGAGVTRPGVAYLNLGTAMVMGVHSPDYRCDSRFRTLLSGVAGEYTLESLLSSGAYLAGWFREQFTGRGSVATLGDFEREASGMEPGAAGLLTMPYWNCAQTPHWNPLVRGAMVGWHGGHGPAHMYRSLLEGVAFEARAHVEGLEAATGCPVGELRLMGGGSRSPLWRQIVSDVLQRELALCAEPEMSALGAGVLALAAVEGTDCRDVLPDGAPTEQVVRPDRAVAGRYEELYGVQQRIYRHMEPLWAELAGLSRSAGQSA